jgi:sigma-E factor negative regulatory protein RseB
MGEEAEPIEQIMFTSLAILPSEEGAPPGSDGQAEAALPVSEPPAVDAGAWGFGELPPGFALVMRDQWQDAAGRPVEHFVLSDGLASVSVYVEADPQEGLDGGTRIGAVHAAGGRVSGHQVTVVGEVPAVTIQAVLTGVRRLAGEER